MLKFSGCPSLASCLAQGEVRNKSPAPHVVRSIHYCGSVFVQLRASRSARLLDTHSSDASSTSGKHTSSGADAEAGMPSGLPESAACIQISIDSRNSAIRSASRTSLRSSSLSEPKYPSLKVSPSEGLGSLNEWRAKSRKRYQQSQKTPHNQTPRGSRTECEVSHRRCM